MKSIRAATETLSKATTEKAKEIAAVSKTPDKITGAQLAKVADDRLNRHKDILMDFCYNEMETHAKAL